MTPPAQEAFEKWWRETAKPPEFSGDLTLDATNGIIIRQMSKAAWTEATRTAFLRAAETIGGWPETTCSCCVHIRPILNDIATTLRKEADA